MNDIDIPNSVHLFKLLTEIDGHPLPADPVTVTLYTKRLGIRSSSFGCEAYLNYSQIRNVTFDQATVIEEKDKSPIGRAAIGGFALGPAGAVVGAISGMGKKKKEADHNYINIVYKDSCGQKNLLKFEDTSIAGNKGKAFVKELRKLSGSGKGSTSIQL